MNHLRHLPLANWPDPKTCQHLTAKSTGAGRFCFTCGKQLQERREG